MSNVAPTPSSAPAGKRAVFFRRTASTLFLWLVVGLTLASMSPWAYLGLIGVLVMLATREFFAMLRGAGVPCFPVFGLALAGGYSLVLYSGFLRGGVAAPGWLDGFALFLAATVPFTLQLRRPVEGPGTLVAIAANVLGFVYVALLFNFCARLIFGFPGDGALPGAFLLLWLLAVTKFSDMGAYITGSICGRHKMIPHISPAKTWEGFAGAILFSQLAACGLYLIFPARLAALGGWGHVVFLGLLLCVLAVIGDLAESVVKRAVGAKDSGAMLPGIGGALDLVDSVCFTAPALFFYLVILHGSGSA
jgi:phosphatidate cytidylyltransferase